MAWYRAGGGGIPSSLKTDMNDVLNKKFGTSQDYPPTDWAPTVNLMGPLPERTASGAIVTFSDGADGVPLKKCEVTLPASLDGYSEIDVVHYGKNLANFSGHAEPTYSGLTITANADGSITFSGTPSRTWAHLTTDFAVDFPIGTYTLGRGASASYAMYIAVKYEDNTTENISMATSASKKFTTTKRIIQIRLDIATLNQSTNYNETVFVQLEEGSTMTDFEPYTAPDTHTASLGRTIYGGTVDVVNGNCEPINWLNNTLTTQTVNGTTFTVNADKSITVSGTPSQQTRVYISQEAITINEAMFFSFGTMPTGTRVFCSRTSGGTTSYPTISPSHTATLDAVYTNFLLEIGTSFDGTAFTIYPLCNKGTSASEYSPYFEPFTFTPITPTPETALGVNNFWADSGDSEVTYRADINLALGGQ